MWQEPIISIIRVLINDLETPPTYSDARLENIALISAFQVTNENSFSYDYVVDIAAGTISPDPVEIGDNSFVNLIALKSSCNVLNGEAKKYAIYSARVMDGPSSIDMGPVAQNSALRAKDACQKYDVAKTLHQTGQLGHIILTPYTNENVNPIKDFT